jgi:hypothetical protein
MERRIAMAVCGRYIGPSFHQEPHSTHIAVQTRHMERGAGMLVSGPVDIRSGLDKQRE